MKKLTLALFIIFILSTISVLADVQLSTPSASPAFADPGSAVTVQFSITNNDTAAYSSVQLISSNPFISGASLGTVATITNLAPNETRQGSFRVNVPANQASGVVSASLTASVSSTNQAVQGYSFTVNAKPALSTVESSLSLSGQPGTTISKTFTLQNTGNVAVSSIQLSHERSTITDSNGNTITVTFSPATVSSLAPGATQAVTLTVNVQSRYATTTESDRVKIDTSGFNTFFLPFTVDIKPLICHSGSIGAVNVNIIHPQSGDNLQVGSLVPVEVDVENSGNLDRTFTVKAIVYDVTKSLQLDSFQDSRSVISGSTNTFKFSMQLPANVNANDNVRVFVKAFGEGVEDTQCAEQDLGMNIQALVNKVTIDSLTFSPIAPACGSTVFGTLHLINHDQNNQDVYVTIQNNQIGLAKQLPLVTLDQAFRSASDQFEQFSLDIPSSARPGTYLVTATASYNGGQTAWQQNLNVQSCEVQPAVTPIATTTTSATTTATQQSQTATTAPPVTSYATKSFSDKLGDVPVWFWLFANLVLALAIFTLALAAIRRR